jgi:class 3 adenylate cyclase
MGDGILIYFGYPQAQEKDSERAVLAGLAMIESIPDLKEVIAGDLQTELAVRIGIATGTVVVGESIGEGAAPFDSISRLRPVWRGSFGPRVMPRKKGDVA